MDGSACRLHHIDTKLIQLDTLEIKERSSSPIMTGDFNSFKLEIPSVLLKANDSL